MAPKILPQLQYFLSSYNAYSRNTFLQAQGKSLEASKNHIREILGLTEYYHGTGAYNHHYTDSKYNGDYIGIRNGLESILIEGLKPQHDLFNYVFETGTSNTISLSGNNIYARCYADLFFEEGKGLDYYYGPSTFWGALIAGKLFYDRAIESFREWIGNGELKDYGHSKERRDRKKELIRSVYDGWTRSFRKDGRYEGKGFAHVTMAKSDIPGNYGVIIGVKSGAVRPLGMKYGAVSAYETRTDHAIMPSHFSHVQVPLGRMDDATRIMENNRIACPMVPMEFVELIRLEEGIERALSRFN